MIEELDHKLQIVSEKSELPKTPDYEKINQLLIEINTEALSI